MTEEFSETHEVIEVVVVDVEAVFERITSCLECCFKLSEHTSEILIPAKPELSIEGVNQ